MLCFKCLNCKIVRTSAVATLVSHTTSAFLERTVIIHICKSVCPNDNRDAFYCTNVVMEADVVMYLICTQDKEKPTIFVMLA